MFPSDNQHYEKVGNTVKCIEDEIPFEIPEGWAWCRLDVAITLLSGQDFQPKYYNDMEIGTPYMTGASNIQNDVLIVNRWTQQPKNISHLGELLLVCKGSGYGKTVINTIGDIHIARQFMSICPHKGITIEYINLFIKAKIRDIKKSGQGVIPGIDRKSILNLLFPVPAEKEQIRITEKYKLLEPKIGCYGIYYDKLEKYNIEINQKLKNSILQYAIQGKFVPQNPDDEPASLLLERIRAEKEQLIKDGKLKRDKNESYIYRGSDNSYYEKFADGKAVCIDEEIPFEIPKNWCWCRLGSISTYGDTKQKVSSLYVESSMWQLDLEDIKKGGNILRYRTVAELNSKGDKTQFRKGDILYSKLRPYLLKILIAPNDGVCTPEIVPFQMYGNINSLYVVNYLKSPYVDNYINSIIYGVKMPRVSTKTMIRLLIPMPPLDEQELIVKKYEEIANNL